MNTFKLDLSAYFLCEAAILVASEHPANTHVTVRSISYNNATGMCTVHTESPVTMREADAFARHCVVHAPLVRYVYDNNNDVTDYVWFSDDPNSFYLTNRTTGDHIWESSICSIQEALLADDVYAPYEQFE